MPDSSFILPALTLAAVLCGLHARIDVYGAFVRGAKDGLVTLAGMAPYLCAVLTAAVLLRETGVMQTMEALFAPALTLLGLPQETAGVALLRPLSSSAALGETKALMDALGADSRAARIACVICAASETIFFTGSLYMGAAGVKRSRYAVPCALLAYLAGVAAAGFFTK